MIQISKRLRYQPFIRTTNIYVLAADIGNPDGLRQANKSFHLFALSSFYPLKQLLQFLLIGITIQHLLTACPGNPLPLLVMI